MVQQWYEFLSLIYYLHDHDLRDASQDGDEVKNVPCVSEVVLTGRQGGAGREGLSQIHTHTQHLTSTGAHWRGFEVRCSVIISPGSQRP